jgi:pheromone shutdown protein TraB
VFAMALGVIAGDIAKEHKKATMGPNHVFRALDELRFGSFVPPLKESLSALKVVKQDKRVAKKQKVAIEEDEEEVGEEEGVEQQGVYKKDAIEASSIMEEVELGEKDGKAKKDEGEDASKMTEE